jgi:soluble lytic murein transglycosylase-like protein
MNGARVLQSAARRILATLQAGLALIGFAAVCGGMLVALDGDAFRRALPLFTTEALSLSAVVAEGPIEAGAIETPLEREQRAMTEYIAKRYRVSEAAVGGYVAAAYKAGAQYSVDPLLILAVMAVESRYNLADHGGEEALLEPEVNIQVGAQILREYQRRFRDTEMALQMYAGAFDEPTSQYANKVFAEKARLELLRQKARRQQSA